MNNQSILRVFSDPRVVEGISQAHSVLRSLDKQFSDEILHLFREISGEL